MVNSKMMLPYLVVLQGLRLVSVSRHISDVYRRDINMFSCKDGEKNIKINPYPG